MKDFEFKSLANLGEDIRAWLGQIPREFEIVVGVPRSGLLIANLISLHRHLPMTDVDGLASGRLIGGGNRFDLGDPAHFLAKPRRVIVVDDSVLTGRQMANVRSRLSCARQRSIPSTPQARAGPPRTVASRMSFSCKESYARRDSNP